MIDITFEVQPFSYANNLKNSPFPRFCKKGGVYLWGFNLKKKSEEKVNCKDDLVIYYVGKSNSQINERLMQEFSQLIFGGFGTILDWDYIKKNKFKLKVKKQQNDYEKGKNQANNKVVYQPTSIADVINFPTNDGAVNSLKKMRERLIFTYFTLDENSNKIISEFSLKICEKLIDKKINTIYISKIIEGKLIARTEKFLHDSLMENILGGVLGDKSMYNWNSKCAGVNHKITFENIPLFIENESKKSGWIAENYNSLKEFNLTFNFNDNIYLKDWICEVNKGIKI
jgi:hypothetical protein